MGNVIAARETPDNSLSSCKCQKRHNTSPVEQNYGNPKYLLWLGLKMLILLLCSNATWSFVILKWLLSSSGRELGRRAASTCSSPMEESRAGNGQGQERLDHPSDQSAGEQQAGSRSPSPGNDVRLWHHCGINVSKNVSHVNRYR